MRGDREKESESRTEKRGPENMYHIFNCNSEFSLITFKTRLMILLKRFSFSRDCIFWVGEVFFPHCKLETGFFLI